MMNTAKKQVTLPMHSSKKCFPLFRLLVLLTCLVMGLTVACKKNDDEIDYYSDATGVTSRLNDSTRPTSEVTYWPNDSTRPNMDDVVDEPTVYTSSPATRDQIIYFDEITGDQLDAIRSRVENKIKDLLYKDPVTCDGKLEEIEYVGCFFVHFSYTEHTLYPVYRIREHNSDSDASSTVEFYITIGLNNIRFDTTDSFTLDVYPILPSNAKRGAESIEEIRSILGLGDQFPEENPGSTYEEIFF
ncbi:MAG: hypothetical protein J5750_06595 [Clostridiales bacterium]|nr:hypothetical protein [Clostridiales bacterium]